MDHVSFLLCQFWRSLLHLDRFLGPLAFIIYMNLHEFCCVGSRRWLLEKFLPPASWWGRIGLLFPPKQSSPRGQRSFEIRQTLFLSQLSHLLAVLTQAKLLSLWASSASSVKWVQFPPSKIAVATKRDRIEKAHSTSLWSSCDAPFILKWKLLSALHVAPNSSRLNLL